MTIWTYNIDFCVHYSRTNYVRGADTIKKIRSMLNPYIGYNYSENTATWNLKSACGQQKQSDGQTDRPMRVKALYLSMTEIIGIFYINFLSLIGFHFLYSTATLNVHVQGHPVWTSVTACISICVCSPETSECSCNINLNVKLGCFWVLSLCVFGGKNIQRQKRYS